METATLISYDLPVLNTPAAVDSEVLVAAAKTFATKGYERFVWIPLFAQSTECLLELKHNGWHVADVIQAPVFKHRPGIFRPGFILEKY